MILGVPRMGGFWIWDSVLHLLHQIEHHGHHHASLVSTVARWNKCMKIKVEKQEWIPCLQTFLELEHGMERHIYKQPSMHPWILHPRVHTNLDWISNTMLYNKNQGKSHNIFQSFIVFNYNESQKQTSVRLRTGLPCSSLSAKCLVFSLTNNRHSINVCSIDQLTESF